MNWHNDFDGPSIADDYARAYGLGPYEDNDYEEEEEEVTMCECGEFEANYECTYWDESFKNGERFTIYLCEHCLKEFIETCIEEGDSYEIKEL